MAESNLIGSNGRFIKFGSGVSSSAKTIQNGLILHLDAGNASSYPGSGTTWTDLSGNGNNGTLIGGPTYSSSNKGFFTFNGSNQSNLPNDFFNQNSNSPCSASAWFKSTSSGIIFGQSGVNSGYVPSIYIGADGKIRTSLFWGGSTSNLQTYSSVVNDGKWYNIVVTFANSVQRSYINGINFGGDSPITQTQYDTNYKYMVAGNYNFGGTWPSQGNNKFSGSISAFLFYNRSLSDLEIKHNFNAMRARFGI